MSFEPVSPLQLHRTGLLDDLSVPTQGFEFGMDWVNSYLLIATWGQSYNEKGYQYVYGYLTLEKRTMDGQMILSVNKEILTKTKR